MLHSRCRSWHLERSMSVERERQGKGGLPVIKTTIGEEDIVIEQWRSAVLVAQDL